MVSLPHPAIRLSAPAIFAVLAGGIALALLIGHRLDAVWAGGEGAGPHQNAEMLRATWYPLQDGAPTLPDSLSRGETVTTDANTFAVYAINDCTLSLAENTSLTLQDGREGFNTFTILTGRIVASGHCTFLTRETSVRVNGTATLVHFSWLDELVVAVLGDESSAVVTQSGETTALTSASGAIHFFTLPSVNRHEPVAFSVSENELIASFYLWSFAE